MRHSDPSSAADPSASASAPAPAALPGEQHVVALAPGHRLRLYEAACEPVAPASTAEDARARIADPPLLLVHSINATASAFEMEPLYLHEARRRRTVALDLPGFGASSRPDARYEPRLMQSAISAAIDWMQHRYGAEPVDLVALSLSCEFATQCVLASPTRVRSLALISPTGMERRRRDERYLDGRTRELGAWRRMLRGPRFGPALYRLLTTRWSMRWFLSRTWGTRHFDERLLERGRSFAQLPGAHHAPLDFVSGALFTRGIIERYRRLGVPTWIAHGTRGAFTNFGAAPEASVDQNGRRLPIRRSVFEAGAMPHFEKPREFELAYAQFLADVRGLVPAREPASSEGRAPAAAPSATALDATAAPL